MDLQAWLEMLGLMPPRSAEERRTEIADMAARGKALAEDIKARDEKRARQIAEREAEQDAT